MFQQTFKNFKLSFNARNEESTFSSGDQITGHVCFDLTKQTKITSVTMALTGRVHVHWSRGGGGKRKHRRVYSAKVDFLNLKAVIMQGNNVTSAAVKLQPGTHMFPFTCQLPQGDFPSSFHGVHGKINYTLTVGINRPWHMSKDFVTELKFVHKFDTNKPELWAPLSGSNQMTLCCLWCASCPITMAVRLEKKAFSPGETLKVICEFSNGSSRAATPKVKLQQKQAFFNLHRVHSRLVCLNLASVTGQPICAHTTYVHTEIMFTIPASASYTISNCSLLDVSYFLEIPEEELPSSFKGSHGKILYTLEANLCRPMRLNSKAKAQFTLLHKGNLNSDPSLMTPQQDMIDMKMKLFTQGTVGMDVNITRTGFHQGEGIKVVASIQNRSSRDIKPKYCLYKKISYFAKRKRRVETKNILKEVGETVPPSAGQTVTRIITIPPTTCVSILNCHIIKTEYRLRVYLDVKYASDPEIKFPIVILPALQGPEEEHPPAYSGYGFGAIANLPPPSYSTYGMYPSLPGFNGKS